MRTGSDLNTATKPFAKDDPARSWRLLLATLGALGACYAAIVAARALPTPWLAQLPLAVLAGLVQVRLFIFYHDHMHGALLHGSKAAGALMAAVGYGMLAVKSVWKESHNYHHKNNAKLIGSSVGSYPVVTLGMWRGMTPTQRRMYRFMRHPLNMALGYFTVFLWGMGISPCIRKPAQHWGGPVAVALHLTTVGVLAWALDPLSAVFLAVLPLMVSLGVGSYLFFAQHNFPEMRLKDRRSWDYTYAALKSSSYFEMGPVMHWFTGNIGYHHVHHLNHRIPFYRLPEAMAAIEELQNPGRTSWRLSDIRANLELAVWDPSQERMLTYAELDEHEGAPAPA